MSQSGSHLEQPGDEGTLSPDVIAADIPNLPLSDHRHGLYAGQRSSGCPKTSEPGPRADQALHPAVVLLHDVVEVLDLAQPGATPKLNTSLHLLDGLWISRIFVDGDGARVYRLWLNKRL